MWASCLFNFILFWFIFGNCLFSSKWLLQTTGSFAWHPERMWESRKGTRDYREHTTFRHKYSLTTILQVSASVRIAFRIGQQLTCVQEKGWSLHWGQVQQRCSRAREFWTLFFFSHSCTTSLASSVSEMWPKRNDSNWRVIIKSKERRVLSALADWLIAVCHSSHGNTLMCLDHYHRQRRRFLWSP